MSELKINKDQYGKHLIIDATVNFSRVLTSEDIVKNYLRECTKIAGMQAVIPEIVMSFPFHNELHGFTYKVDKELKNIGIELDCVNEMIQYVKAKEVNDTGVSGISIWNTSHESVHTWSDEFYVSIDLYSCLDFDERPILNYTKEHFGTKEMRIVEVMRHVSLPQTVRQWQE